MSDINQSYGTVTGPGSIRYERLLPGPIERVWSYLIDSDKRALWLGSGVIEPRTGAAFELKFQNSEISTQTKPVPEELKSYDGKHESKHKVLKCEPPRLLSFTWGNGKGGESEVTFELTPKGDKVLLVLDHRLLAASSTMLNISGGWHSHLNVLIERLNGKQPENFWNMFGELKEEYKKRLADAVKDME